MGESPGSEGEKRHQAELNREDSLAITCRALAARRLRGRSPLSLGLSVAPYHFSNAKLRALENSVALVRATAQGQSAAVAPDASVVASFDHTRAGIGTVVADVPVIRASAPQ